MSLVSLMREVVTVSVEVVEVVTVSVGVVDVVGEVVVDVVTVTVVVGEVVTDVVTESDGDVDVVGDGDGDGQFWKYCVAASPIGPSSTEPKKPWNEMQPTSLFHGRPPIVSANSEYGCTVNSKCGWPGIGPKLGLLDKSCSLS